VVPASHAPTAAERRSIKHLFAVLFRAIEHRHYALACQHYEPGARHLLVLAARIQFHRQSIGDCPEAFAVIVKSSGGDDGLATIRPPRVRRITVSGQTATALLEGTRPGGGTTRETFALVHDSRGWQITVSANPRHHPTAP